MRTIAAILMALLLAGCAADNVTATQPSRYSGEELSREEILAASETCANWADLVMTNCGDPGIARVRREGAINRAENAKCLSYGFQPGTEAYSNCRLELTRVRAAVLIELARPSQSIFILP